MAIVRKASAVGGSVGVMIPRKWREALRIYKGSPLMLTLRDGRIIVEKAVVLAEHSLGTPSPQGDDSDA